WNMLFFLWGIFKGRRVNHSDSVKNIVLPSLNVAVPIEKDFPTAVMTLSDTRCSPVRIDEESIACGKACSELPATSIDQGHIILSKDFDIKDTIVDQTHLGSQVNFDRQDSRINNTKSSSRISTNVIQPCREMNTIDSSLKEKGSLSEHGLHRESKSPEEAGTIVRAMTVETKPNYGISVKQEILTANSTLKDKISERTNNDENQRRPKRKEREDDLNINVEETFQGDLAIEAVNLRLPNDIKVEHI
ncbi:putative RING/FYVE/PHD zinc finger protein, partial [Trifolium medium]|nr:putative RING/FYVE/PHD zinc finger protein [Trifolium medium]